MSESPCSDEETAVRTWRPFRSPRGDSVGGKGESDYWRRALRRRLFGDSRGRARGDPAGVRGILSAPADRGDEPRRRADTFDASLVVGRPDRVFAGARRPGADAEGVLDRVGPDPARRLDRRTPTRPTRLSRRPTTRPTPIPPPPRRHPTRPSLHRRCPRIRSSSSRAPTPAPAAAPPAPTPAPAAPAAPSGAPPAVVVVLQDTPAPAAAAADDEAAKEEAAVAAAVAIVSFKPRPAPAAISLLPTDDTAVAAPQKKAGVGRAAGKRLVRPATCARPTARVPLSQRGAGRSARSRVSRSRSPTRPPAARRCARRLREPLRA